MCWCPLQLPLLLFTSKDRAVIARNGGRDIIEAVFSGMLSAKLWQLENNCDLTVTGIISSPHFFHN
jgi:hypothetical protein